jgi:hypothetical protein
LRDVAVERDDRVEGQQGRELGDLDHGDVGGVPAAHGRLHLHHRRVVVTGVHGDDLDERMLGVELLDHAIDDPGQRTRHADGVVERQPDQPVTLGQRERSEDARHRQGERSRFDRSNGVALGSVHDAHPASRSIRTGATLVP